MVSDLILVSQVSGFRNPKSIEPERNAWDVANALRPLDTTPFSFLLTQIARSSGQFSGLDFIFARLLSVASQNRAFSMVSF